MTQSAKKLEAGLWESYAEVAPRHLEGYLDDNPNLVRPVLVFGNPTDALTLSAVTLSYGSKVGKPYIEKKEGDRFVHEIRPQKNAPEQSSSSSECHLRLHTENPYEDLEPDLVLIGCVNNSEGAATLISNPNRVFMEMDDSRKELLQGPYFSFLEAGKFAAAAGRSRRTLVENERLVTPSTDGLFDFHVDFEAMFFKKKAIPAVIRALREFEQLSEGIAQEIVLEPGHVLILPNHRVLHGRKFFAPRRESFHRRHLLRLFAMNK